MGHLRDPGDFEARVTVIEVHHTRWIDLTAILARLSLLEGGDEVREPLGCSSVSSRVQCLVLMVVLTTVLSPAWLTVTIASPLSLVLPAELTGELWFSTLRTPYLHTS